uniref:E3 UFM1-protein ligase 1 n=1 Tax=Electrophorus electricus TaxID=8005 RepID=A0A4W4EHK2_ELEEL
MAADWDEIRRLAADFQRAQIADVVQKLSERNCIEIVAKLVEDKKLDVVHTLDGKEYITPSQISREVREELYVHGGRINIVDLQKIINVDLVHVESRASELAKSDPGTQLILGQLIDENYLDQLAEEVNDKLQESGQVNIAELCKTYDLPGDFLTEELCARLGRVIQGQVDQYNRGVIFTQAFVSRHKARVRGLFSALTRPTPVRNLIGLYGFQENLLYSVLQELVTSGRLKGSVVGGRQHKAVYIPDIYSRTQSSWVDSFLKQNGYLEFDALSRLGIPDPASYIKKRFKSHKLLFLRAACVDSAIVDQLEASVEEAVTTATLVDLQPMVPSCLSEEDVALLLGQAVRAVHAQSSTVLLGTVVVSEKFIRNCLALFDDIMLQKAQKEVKNNPVFLITEEDVKQGSVLLEGSASSKKDKREERRKKASEGTGSLRGGGGGNAREIRIRKTKKKNRREEESDDETQATSESTSANIMSLWKQNCLSIMVMFSYRPLTKAYQEVVRTAVMSSTSTGSGGNRKQNVKDLQEEINNLYNNIRLFEKGAKLFTDETQLNIVKHVLRSVCTDVTNMLVTFIAAERMMTSDNPTTITAEMRLKVLALLPDDTKVPLMKLHNSLNGKSIEGFLCSLETCAEECGFLLKKADKKREKQALLLHRQTLLEQLKQVEEPALVLHLVSVLLFQGFTHHMLHAPGRCVPSILSTLQPKLPQDQYELLVQYQSLVVKQLVAQSHGGTESSDELDTIQRDIHRLTHDVKDLLLSPRKPSTTDE